MTLLSLLPATLSLLLLAAHFFRGGHAVPTALVLVALGLLFIQRTWAGWILQALLLLGGVEWCRTLWVLVGQRRAFGLPWVRMALILAGVALFAALAAAILQTPPAKRWFGARRGD